jgi:hypothetical protein
MRRTDCPFQRPGSRNWHIKLQSPKGRIEKSLRTPDRVQAEILALPMIAEHKRKLLAARPHLETVRKLARQVADILEAELRKGSEIKSHYLASRKDASRAIGAHRSVSALTKAAVCERDITLLV